MGMKNKKLSKKEDQIKREELNVKLAPNVEGERVESWGEAVKLAKSKGKDTTLYEKKAQESKES
jgi:adenosine deaminase